MNTKAKLHDWMEQITLFSTENVGRPTRLGVFEPLNYGLNDYWLEDRLPLNGIDVDQHDGEATITIHLDGYTYRVPRAKRINLHYSVDGTDDGFDVVDAAGRTSVLRFETELA